MTASLIDWTNLKQHLDETLFQQICRDLLKALGLQVEPTSSPSEHILLLHSEATAPILVACRSQHSVHEAALTSNLITHLASFNGERIDAVVVFTNVSLSEASKKLLDRINESRLCNLKVGYIEGRDLERLLVCQLKVYRKYFRGQPSIPEDLDCSSIRSPNVICAFATNTRFLQKDTVMKLHVSNSGPSPLELSASVGGEEIRRFKVGTFGREALSISASELAPSKWSSLELVPISDPSSSVTVEDSAQRPLLPIDHVYVDPLGWRETVRRSLTGGGRVYLSGGPGTGKSRLLRESCAMDPRPIWIDLSHESYSTSLVDHLLSRLFDLELETVRLFREDFLLSRLQELGSDDLGARAVLGYLKRDVETVGTKAFTRILAQLSAASFGDRVLVIDNVHRLRHLDGELLRALLSSDYAGAIVFTARDQEIEDPELLALLEWGSRTEQFVHLVLDEVPVSRLIGRFLEEATADEDSRRFLAVLRHAPNMQQFMLAIKSFRARELIAQEDDGRLRVLRGGTEIRMAEYRDLLSDMLAALGSKSGSERLTQALESAAVFGSSFDLEFLEETLGEEILEAIALLEEKELILPEAGRSEDFYRFDHELTQEIVYGSISGFRKRRLHRQVIAYMETPSRYKPGADDERLSRHYEVVQEFGKSAELALSSARFLLRRHGITAGHAEYERALRLSEQLRLASVSEETDARSYVLEAHALEGLIDAGSAKAGGPALFHQVRKLDALMKLYPADDSDRHRLEGRVAFYFGRHYNLLGENEKARRYITLALDRLRAAGALSNLGEVLARACTLEKNCGRWDEAVRYGEEAVAVFKEARDSEGLSEAYVDLGAVYLEAGEPEKTIPWWERAVEVVEGKRGAERATCSALIDLSYILALVTPEAPRVEHELRRASDLAKRLAMDSDEARARLNLANWLYFHGDDPDAARPHLKRAEELIARHEDQYLDSLYKFSLLNLDRVSGEERQRLEASLEEIACGWVERQGGIEATGDNRILNMIEYLGRRGGEQARSLVASQDRLEADGGRSENPYRRGNRFITLY